MKTQKISIQPYKGTRDYYKDNFQRLNYILETWKKVCKSFGYEEYLTPLLEPSEIYKAKSGEVKEELFTLQDRAGRELALRPEMTPSVTRLVSSFYKGSPKPIKVFSVAPFYRNEAPQKGRGREFWQMNADVFGETGLNADLEVISLAIEIMLAFKAEKGMFKIFINSRKLIDDLLSIVLKVEINKDLVSRLMDKSSKLTEKAFDALGLEYGLNNIQIKTLKLFLSTSIDMLEKDFPELKNSDGLRELTILKKSLEDMGYSDFFEIKTSIVRGFDYYDGMIFECFDTNPSNPRSMFGGGRYNGLADLFGNDNFPATGFAPGNMTTEEFLTNWNLWPNNLESSSTYFPLLKKEYFEKNTIIANKLRVKGTQITQGLSEESLNDALRNAQRRGFKYVIIRSEKEISKNIFQIKNLETGEQKELS